MNSRTFAVALATLTTLIIWWAGTITFTFVRKRHIRNFLHSYQTSAVRSASKEAETAFEHMNTRQRLINASLQTPYGHWFQELSTRSGTWHDQRIRELIWRKLELASAAFLLGLLLSRNGSSSPIVNLILLPSLAFFTPDLLLRVRASKRIGEIESALPETIDLLSMCVHAGLGFQAGIQRVAQTKSNPLSDEFNRVLSEIKLGESRSDAFIGMSERLGIEPLRQFVNAVLQVDRLGVPIAKVLDDQSARMRALRRESAREQAQKVPVKILAPIMLFLMPAVFIIVLGPAAVTIIRAFSQ